MVRDAVTSRSVVIDSFDAPPVLAASGLSGRVVAAGLLDVLTRIQAANQSSAEHRALSNAWTSEITIEIPETGVSIGQLERMLKTRFGHDQHIDGNLVQTETGGLALAVRGTGILPKTFTDEARNLEKLLTQAGEYAYAQSQPGLWGSYLNANNRSDEAIRFARIGSKLGRRNHVLPVPTYLNNRLCACGNPFNVRSQFASIRDRATGKFGDDVTRFNSRFFGNRSRCHGKDSRAGKVGG